MSIISEAADLDAAHDLLQRHYTKMHLTSSGTRRSVRIELNPLGPVRLDHLTFAMTAHVAAKPLRTVCIGHVLGGNVTYHHHRDEIACKPGDVAFVAQPNAPWNATLRDLDIELACLEPALLTEVAQPGPESPGPVRLTGYRPVSPTATTLWSHTYRYVHTTATDLPAAPGNLLTGSLARLLAATALTVFPNTALTDPTIEDRHDAHPDTLHRAIAFIDDNAHRDISVADIAAATHVTIRAVQLAFRRHRDITPMAYLRRVRLDHAHRNLVSADAAVNTVGEIAIRWGFPDHSRFTAAYHAAYGRTPSATLRND